MNAQKMASILFVGVVGAVLVASAILILPEYGTFPQRKLGTTEENAIGQWYIENAPLVTQIGTGSANVVTSIVWGYRGYDTFGESTVLFTAVVGVLAVLRAIEKEED